MNILTVILLLGLFSASACIEIRETKSQALPDRIVAGEIHYSRIPVEYWEHRLQMVKSMGFNALSVYVMWNYHEVSFGKFDYNTDAKKYGFYVLIRPGPYVCAEWDFGGMPTRFLLSTVPN
jgi:beta-galactosidase